MMSTKITLHYDQDIHFYTECFDEQHIYMQLNRDLDLVSVNVRLTTEQAIGLSNQINIGELRRQADLTDEQILKHTQETVAARVKTPDFFGQLTGLLVYGMVDDPVEDQIASGVSHYTKIRDKLKQLVGLLDNKSRRGSTLQFGLEEISG